MTSQSSGYMMGTSTPCTGSVAATESALKMTWYRGLSPGAWALRRTGGA